MRQRSITFLFAILMSMVGVQLFAYDAKVDGIYYNFSENEAIVTGASSTYSLNKTAYTGSVVIPESVTYDGITYSVTGIGNYAFQGCEELASLFIPNTVTSIGNSVFTGCKSLDTMIIPNSVTSIGYSAFYNSGLTSVTIGNSVADIGVSAFECCSNLTSITVQSGNTTYDSRDNCNAIIQTTTNTLVAGCKETVIPNSVTDIGTSAFAGNKSMTTIDIPNTVTSIGDFAFNACLNLVSVNIPNSVTTIGNGAFLSCASLNSVSIPNSVTSMGGGVFSGCSSLSSVTIGNSLSSIGYNVFADCRKLTSLTIGNSVESIGDYAFQGCSGLTSVVIPNSVKTIGNYAFERCYGLLSLSIPYSVTTIGDYAFRDCSGLTSITLSNSVTSIGKYAFYCCSGLTSITIPNSVTSVGDWAFEGCSSVSDMYCYANDIPSNSLSISKYGNAVLHVPADAVPTYQAMLPGGFNEVVAIDENVITDITLIDSQQTENQDKVYWNGEEMVFPTGYENFDKQLNFCYVVEKGIFSDTKWTVKEAEWNYPESLIKQLTGIQNPRAVHYADDYNYKYDGVSFTALENGTGYDFVDGRYRSFEDSILVRISPANADLSKAEIALLNNKGENIVDAGLIQVLDVTAEGNETGLWVIKFKLNDENVGTLYEKYAHSTAGDILYAVAVKNTDSSTSEGSEPGNVRYVVSDYELSLNQEPVKHVWDFNVNGVSIADIHNRYIHAGESTNGTTRWTDDPITPGNKSMFRYELTWKDLCPEDFPDTTSAEGREAKDDFDCWNKIGYTTILFDAATDGYEDNPYACGINTVDRHIHSFDKTTGVRNMEDGFDNRQKYDFLPVIFSEDQAPEGETGEWAKIEIEFPSFNACDERTPIRGFFVTMDQHYAIESDNTELNGWPLYITKNIAKYPYGNGRVKSDEQALLDLFEQAITLQKGNKGSVWVKLARNLRCGDVIGFRVHAVNLDGTLTDPDGRAFYVKVDGNEKLTFDVQADTLESYAVSNCDVTLNPYDNYKVELTWRGNNPAIRAAGTGTEAYMPVAGTNGPLRVEDFFDFQLPTDDDATMRAAIKANVANRLIDGATYKITMKILREVSQDEWTVDKAYDINIKKVMPTALPENFSVRLALLQDNICKVYLRPEVNQDPWKIAGNDSYSWGVDARPYTLDELFNGMIVGDNLPRRLDKNYFFEIANSGEDGSAVAFGFDDSFTNEQHEDGGYHLPKIHRSHVDDGELHEVKAGYIYRNISATLQADGKAFLPPSGSERYGESSGIANQDYRFDAIPFDRTGKLADESFIKLKYSCALDAALTMTVDDMERKFEQNQDVYVNIADAKFKLSRATWAEGSYSQDYTNAQLPIKTMKEELTLSDMLAQSYFQIDVNSLKVSATNPVGLDFSHYSSPFFSVGETVFNPDENSITQIDGIKMYRNAALMENFKTAECALSFDIYDVWQHKRTVSIPFVIDGPVNPEDPKPGDLDGDGHLDYNDVMALSAIVVSDMTGDDADPAADFNGDGKVDINDITALIDMLTR